MKSFFSSSYYFWLITRILFIIATIISSFSNLGENLTPLELIANLIILLYSFAMCYNTFLDFSIKEPIKTLKYFTGGISILIGAAIFILTFSVQVINLILALLFIIWVVLLGIFDLLLIRRKQKIEEIEE